MTHQAASLPMGIAAFFGGVGTLIFILGLPALAGVGTMVFLLILNVR